jgi:hypothetical protein
MKLKRVFLPVAATALSLAAFQAGASAPAFVQYSAPKTMGANAGEPSIGVVWNPGATLQHDTVNAGGVILFQSGANTLRISLDDATAPATATWEDVSTTLVRQFVLSDPIGFVDQETGRVFTGDLIGGEGQSFMAFSDDSGETYTPSEGGPPGGSPDHETIGSGPYAVPLAPGPVYPRAVYYCGQAIVTNFCSRSDDGGMVFGPQIPTVAPPDCEPAGAQNGHVKVGPDGSVYLPQGKCPNAELLPSVAAVSISDDNGITWHFSQVPNSSSNNLDPSIAIDAGNNLYLTWLDADNIPHVATSHDHGATWVNDTKPGDAFGIKNANFVISTAGDAGRAAVGFIGSAARGDPNAINTYTGVWHMYIAVTYDAGATWTTVDATPDDPIQVGSVCTSGTTCGADRNLLDFNDMQIDKQGRIVVGFADGCLPPTCTTATAAKHPPYNTSRSARASVLRQTGGKTLLAAYDDTVGKRTGSSGSVAGGTDPVPASAGAVPAMLSLPFVVLALLRRRRSSGRRVL